MKLLTDEQHAQIVEALKHGIIRMNLLGDALPVIPLHEALATLTAAPSLEPCGYVTKGYFALGTGLITEYKQHENCVSLYAIKKETP